MQSKRAAVGIILAAWSILSCANAQTIDIWPGKAPGSESWTYVEKSIEKTPNGAIVVNVSKPTLTAFLPDRKKATGTGVIIAPGGAFVALAIDQEGRDVARWLQDKGIAAFVLKYRLMEQRQGGGMPAMKEMEEAGKYAAADGVQALKVLREQAAQWGISPDRIGFIGFSAGATVATAPLLGEDAAARPSFAALLYGGPFGGPAAVPKQLPPVFLAWAQDDPIAGNTVVKLYDAMKAAGHKPEAHAYSTGGHAFGLRKQGLSSDHWIDSLYYWMEAQGYTKPAAKQGR